MTDHDDEPQSLLAVTNWQSRALLPSEVYDPRFIEWAHDHGAYLYMVLIGPKTEICDLMPVERGWKVRARFHDGTSMKPRTIAVPFELLPADSTKLVNGAVEWTDAAGTSHRSNAVQIARAVLTYGARPEDESGQWREHTIRKFFTYRVEYVGRAYNKSGERTAAERIGEGHKQVQQLLAEVADLHPSAAVALIVMDAQIQGREAVLRFGPDNRHETMQFLGRFVAQPDGPLVEQSKLVTAAEAMLIRSFPDARNIEYKSFPVKDAPTLVNELRAAGISHLGVQLDVSQSMALIHHPDPRKPPAQRLRFAVNLETGELETLSTRAPLAWRAD